MFEQTPHTVIINEALEIARRFSTFEATQFINGILDAIKQDLEKELDSKPPKDKEDDKKTKVSSIVLFSQISSLKENFDGRTSQEFLKQTISNLDFCLKDQLSQVRDKTLSDDFLKHYFQKLHTLKGSSQTFNFNNLAIICSRN